MSTENALLSILVEKINNDILVLPTLPAIALKVRKAADNPDIHLNDMADVIGQDASLSARMIKISNSVYMGRTVKVSSTAQAVTRIGLRQIKNIATALAMEQLFVSKNDIVKDYMQRAWTETVQLVANSMAVLQVYVKQTKNRNLNMDTMTLAALVHNIGILPILTEAERHADVFANPSFLNVAIEKMSGRIGASITRKWGFDDEFIQVAEHWNNLSIQTDNISYLDFVRLGKVAAGYFEEQKEAVLEISIKKGIIKDISDLESDAFNEMRDSALQTFA
ncbi:MAG: HD-like signal output (HDOD) protein [Paraglaciecola sp.]|jgi:HD-like signal output (HDOD) protein